MERENDMQVTAGTAADGVAEQAQADDTGAGAERKVLTFTQEEFDVKITAAKGQEGRNAVDKWLRGLGLDRAGVERLAAQGRDDQPKDGESAQQSSAAASQPAQADAADTSTKGQAEAASDSSAGRNEDDGALGTARKALEEARAEAEALKRALAMERIGIPERLSAQYAKLATAYEAEGVDFAAALTLAVKDFPPPRETAVRAVAPAGKKGPDSKAVYKPPMVI